MMLLIVLLSLQRFYWPTPLDTLAIGHQKHTHAAVTGTVAYVRKEDDGDIHIKLVSPSGRFIIAECIPALPCAPPKVGLVITVYGITRLDTEHGWREIHPCENWTYN
jgi:hypothetical protein